jgi:hypothetical protein
MARSLHIHRLNAWYMPLDRVVLKAGEQEPEVTMRPKGRALPVIP